MSNRTDSQGVTILGATGSIGVSTLDVLKRHPERYFVTALTANRNVDRLFQQCQQVRPAYAVMVNENAAEQLSQRCQQAGLPTEVLAGLAGLERVAALPEAKMVMAAIVGAAGLLPTLAAVRAGKRVLLANKEALVMTGQLLMDEVQRCGAELLPIDSEHNAVFQCMPLEYAGGLQRVGVEKVLLTASGGPFRTTPVEQLSAVTPDQACAHPNWIMGRKISVDSATMMNKGLEVIEAHWLFAAAADKIEVVLHPESVIHSMVSYRDGSVLAQLGNPDMRTPIAHALAWPERIESGVAPLDLLAVGQLNFEQPNLDRFPCLRLAFEALRQGGTASTLLNAANEIAVERFLDGRLGFMQIHQVIEATLAEVAVQEATDLSLILQQDQLARDVAVEQADRLRKVS
ncbi:MAG: 1-deoxy-D-xylulose-5-phosphate reductoisomerase [Gammaproteobacteria bacterium]|nr:1-deoxy-D-xylulose-5-phosphate reductoisomerase [Gammaproteobacteria bacterium]